MRVAFVEKAQLCLFVLLRTICKHVTQDVSHSTVNDLETWFAAYHPDWDSILKAKIDNWMGSPHVEQQEGALLLQ
jgi:hypothetical protein